MAEAAGDSAYERSPPAAATGGRGRAPWKSPSGRGWPRASPARAHALSAPRTNVTASRADDASERARVAAAVAEATAAGEAAAAVGGRRRRRLGERTTPGGGSERCGATRVARGGRPTVPLYKEPERRHGVVFSFASECTCDARSQPPVDVNILVIVSGSLRRQIATNRGLHTPQQHGFIFRFSARSVSGKIREVLKRAARYRTRNII